MASLLQSSPFSSLSFASALLGVSYHSTPPPPQQPTFGFPQPVPPPGAFNPAAHPPRPPHHHPQYYAHGYQTVPGYAVAEGRLVREHRLPCYGIGVGWFLFIIGFFPGTIPWYVGVLFFFVVEYIIKRNQAKLLAQLLLLLLPLLSSWA